MGALGGPVERETLVCLLVYGNLSASEIAQRTGRPRPSVQTRLTDLEQKELAENMGAGTYGLTEIGAEFARTLLRDRTDEYFDRLEDPDN